MDGITEKLKEKLDRQLRELTETAAALQVAERAAGGSLHYSRIEASAHQLGTELSCQIQARTAREVVALSADRAACPSCGTMCELETVDREVTSIDGRVPLCESRGFCNRCRRSFFPAA